mmetsp:Transcript_7522/g.15704  ORF Transcript_7522/g.15704 Transcript_7522/m.15704 type:complete len:713 (+) Transcript_7522:130-2268(+)
MTDVTTTAAGSEEAAPSPSPSPSPPPENPRFTIPIHTMIESSRSEHGLSRGGGGGSAGGTSSGVGVGGARGGGDDHAQYRKYCGRKLARLRRSRDVRKELSHGSSGGKSTGGGAGGGGGATSGKKSKKGKKKGKKGSGGGGGAQGGGGGGGKKGGGGGGRYAYHPRPHPDPYDATHHVHYSLVSLYSAERCWSHAMEIKTLYDDARDALRLGGGAKKKNKKRGTSDGDDQHGGAGAGGGNRKATASSPAKIRRHYVRRLRKAVAYATELESRTKVSCDDRTAVEARAYAGWMRGTLALEVGDWQSACTEYGSALTICRALGQGESSAATTAGTNGDNGAEASASDTAAAAAVAAEDLEMRDFFAARAEHVLEPLLRYCQYELQEGGMDQSALASLMKAQEDAENALLAASSFPAAARQQQQSSPLRSKLDSLRDDKRFDEASAGSSMATVHFRSRDVAVESQVLRFDLLKIVDLRSELAKERQDGAKDSAAYETKFLSLLSLYDDAISLASSDLKEYQAMKAGPAVNAKKFEFQSLLGYIKYEKLKLLMGRNEDMVDNLRAAEEEAGNDVTPKTLEQIAHLYDALLQDARSVAQLPGGSPDGSGAEEDEDEFVLEANANVLRLRALRCYYVARLYALDIVAKHAEAAALFDQCKLLASRAAEEIAACQDMDDSLIESMDSLEDKIRAAKNRSVACAFLARLEAKEEVRAPTP